MCVVVFARFVPYHFCQPKPASTSWTLNNKSPEHGINSLRWRLIFPTTILLTTILLNAIVPFVSQHTVYPAHPQHSATRLKWNVTPPVLPLFDGRRPVWTSSQNSQRKNAEIQHVHDSASTTESTNRKDVEFVGAGLAKYAVSLPPNNNTNYCGETIWETKTYRFLTFVFHSFLLLLYFRTAQCNQWMSTFVLFFLLLF